ncbi:hypothetical protein [Mycolicibacterium baixiangningiae]|uniref:hypothetical protein n=1 Tax=Mycolicibacterium baixiangningiae TaxID=2761578 RepID=UPI001866181E|nr:hypothetical protein [Mycolicibacterium baixiangningiae]
MIPEYEDVPGAAAAARATVAREYALRRIAAQLDDTRPTFCRPTTDAEDAEIRAQAVRTVERGAQYAGLTLAEVDAAELEVRRVYLDASGREYLLSVARHEITLLSMSEPDGPGPDAEGYRFDGGAAL